MRKIYLLPLSGLLVACATHGPTPAVQLVPPTPLSLPSQVFAVENLPLVGTTRAAQDIQLSGLSALWYQGIEQGKQVFYSLTDRGPNALPLDEKRRPFLLPDFQPRILKLVYDASSGRVTLEKRIPLRLPNGKPVTGLPNRLGEEDPVDIFGKALRADPNGLDAESLVRTADGSFWIGDEYGPSLVHFSYYGKCLERFVPEGTLANGALKTSAILPAIFGKRRPNRGFESLALDGNKLYAFLQSPVQKKSQLIPVLEFDLIAKRPSGIYLYPLQSAEVDKLSDAVRVAPGSILVVESDSQRGPRAVKRVMRVSLAGATNLLHSAQKAAALQATKPEELQALAVTALATENYMDLVAHGFTYSDKAEGLSLTEDSLVVANDNDFALDGIPNAQGVVPMQDQESRLLFIPVP